MFFRFPLHGKEISTTTFRCGEEKLFSLFEQDKQIKWIVKQVGEVLTSLRQNYYGVRNTTK